MRPLNERANNRFAGGEARARGTPLQSLASFPTASAAQFRQFERGDRVEARYSDGKWYPATVVVVNLQTRQAKVQWDDATPPSALALSDLRASGEDSELDSVVDELMGHGKQPDPKAMEQNERFRAQMERLSAQAGGLEEFRPDVTRKVMLQALYSTTAELIPTAANKYATEKNESAAYAFNTLANKLQQLGSELDQMDSLEEKSNYIVSRLVMPMLVRGTQNLAHGMAFVNAKLGELRLEPVRETAFKRELEDMIRQHVFYMQESATALEEQINAYLIGEAPVKGRAPKKPAKQIAPPVEMEDA